MSWILVATLIIFTVAVVLIELRAVREGDERRHTAPGFVLVTIGVFMLALGVAAAIAEDEMIALATVSAGLVAVALGATSRGPAAAH